MISIIPLSAIINTTDVMAYEGYYDTNCGYYDGQVISGSHQVLSCNNRPLNANYQTTKTCTLSEHTHTSSCYTTETVNVPGQTGTWLHTSHGNKNDRYYCKYTCTNCGETKYCYDHSLGSQTHTCSAATTKTETKLTCTLTEHTHSSSCYSSGYTSHTHSSSCYTTVDDTYTHYHSGSKYTGTGCYAGGTYHRYPASFGSLPESLI